MAFYTYSQNNSGGFFCEPAKYVIVEADSQDEANEIAQEHGVYFNGCATGVDCSCCGDRWYPCWEDATDEPMIYNTPAAEYKDDFLRDPVPVYVCYRKDGSVQGAV